jgi:hypothetical protein
MVNDTKMDYVGFVGGLMAVVMPLVLLKNHLSSYLRSFMPSYVERIVHFDTKLGHTHVVYVAWKKLYSLKRATYEILGMPKDGYYMFVLWNSSKQKYDHIVLEVKLVEAALGIKNVYNMWAMNEFAIVLMLSNFVDYDRRRKNDILGISINHKDVTRRLRPFMPSITMENNVRPNVLRMLVGYLEGTPVHAIDIRSVHFMYTDYDLEEMVIDEANEYIVPVKMRSHPIVPMSCDASSSEKPSHVYTKEKSASGTSEIEELFEQVPAKKDKNE